MSTASSIDIGNVSTSVDGNVYTKYFAAAQTLAIPVQPEEQAEDTQEDQVEIRGVVPLEGWLDDLRRTADWNEAGSGEEVFGRQAGRRHHQPEGRQDPQRQCPSIEPPIDQEQRKRNQVREDEADHPAEADPAFPQRGCQRHVADRTDEAQDGDQRADDHVFH